MPRWLKWFKRAKKPAQTKINKQENKRATKRARLIRRIKKTRLGRRIWFKKRPKQIKPTVRQTQVRKVPARPWAKVTLKQRKLKQTKSAIKARAKRNERRLEKLMSGFNLERGERERFKYDWFGRRRLAQMGGTEFTKELNRLTKLSKRADHNEIITALLEQRTIARGTRRRFEFGEFRPKGIKGFVTSQRASEFYMYSEENRKLIRRYNADTSDEEVRREVRERVADFEIEIEKLRSDVAIARAKTRGG